MPSKLHLKIGEVLKSTPPFSGCTLRQEVSVSELFVYPNNRDKWDWVIPDLNLIIEGMGIQHEKPQTFGATAEESLLSFNAQKIRDKKKKEAAINAGWTYLAISYKDYDLLDGSFLVDLYLKEINNKPLVVLEKTVSSYKQDQKKYQKEMYRKIRDQKKLKNRKST
jgi:hypothetical protein